MDNNNGGKYSGYFSKKLKAGKRRTYFFDVRSTKQGDFFLTITESKKKFDSDGYESHKIFLYKEDFKKFLEALNETVDYIKSDLMPDYDYESERPASVRNNNHQETGFSENHSQNHVAETNHTETTSSENTTPTSTPSISDDEVMNWD
ncbi:MAG: DUF3276 family protein [Chitinophagales bacterium]|nr:DUF3276 family protein [Chitinophagales bacterium]